MAASAAQVVSDFSEMVGCTREARLYAVKELARRAGVSAEMFHCWKVECEYSVTKIYVQPGTKKCVRFKNLSAQRWQDLVLGKWHTSRAKWTFAPSGTIQSEIPDFVVPFSFSQNGGELPLFSPVDGDTVVCNLDLPLSTLLTLSRFEEIHTKQRDVHGRFSSPMSIASRDGFLNRPIVDEYGLALEQVLKFLLPGWQPRARQLRVKLSHDIDTVGRPFRLRTTLGHTVRRGRPLATMRDLVAKLQGRRPIYLDLVQSITQQSLERGLDSAVYWKGSPPGPLDSGYDPRHPQVQEVVHWVERNQVESGVHPGYDTFLSRTRLEQELEVLQQALGKQPRGGRQHYLRWSPQTWEDWEQCGLAYDSTVGYAEHVGFRAGTCWPYRPWLLWLNRQVNLIEIPLIVMDCVLPYEMGLSPERSLEVIRDCARRCRWVGGVFTLLWHNSSLIEPIYGDTYETVLDELAGQGRFDWRSPAEEVY